MEDTGDQDVVIEGEIKGHPELGGMGTEVPEFCSVRDALTWFASQRAFFEEFGMDTRVDLDREGQVSLLVGREKNKVWLQELSDALGLKITEASDDEFVWRLVDEDSGSNDD